MNDQHSDDDRGERAEPAQREPDNDQDSHVSPSDNDGETVPQDEVVDEVGG